MKTEHGEYDKDDLERAKKDELRMDAYYYGFEKTGVEEVDQILSSVAIAGKMFHNTADWTDIIEYGELNGISVVDNIQKKANESASKIKKGRRNDFKL